MTSRNQSWLLKPVSLLLQSQRTQENRPNIPVCVLTVVTNNQRYELWPESRFPLTPVCRRSPFTSFTLDKPQSRVVCHSVTSPPATPDLCHHLITVLSVNCRQVLRFSWTTIAYRRGGGGLLVRITQWQDCKEIICADKHLPSWEMMVTLRIIVGNGNGPHCFHKEDQNIGLC